MELDLRAAEHAVGAEPEQFRLLVESVGEYAIYLLDPGGHVRTWNAGAERIKGYAAAEVVGRHYAMFHTPEDRAAGRPQHVLRHAEREGSFRGEGWRLRKDGSRFWADVAVTALRARSGELRGFAKVTRDMTATHRTEQALRESRTLLEEAQKVAGLGCWEWDPASGRLHWSDELYRIYGADPASFRPSFEAYLGRVHPDDRARVSETVAAALVDGRGFQLEERIVRLDGAQRVLRSQGEVVKSEAGRPLKMLGACFDVTEQKASEERLRAAAGTLQRLSRRLVEAEEAERRRIARELHDRVGQNLSALNINLDIVLGMLGEQAPREVRVRLRDSLALVDGTLQTIENVMADLRPPLLDEYGLGAALGWHAEEFVRRTHLRVDFEDRAKERTRELAPEAAVTLFRIAQEALNNVAKHAQATQAKIFLDASEKRFVLTITDDGRGFDPAAPTTRLGLRSMRERIDAAGGALSVLSAPGKGASVKVEVPL